MRNTSQAAWESLVASGRLGKRQGEAYDCVYKHGPLTGQEAVQKTGIPGLWKRMSELDRLGVIAACSERKCTVTGELAITWDVTTKIPTDDEIAAVRPKKAKKEGYGIVWFKDGTCLVYGTREEAWARLSKDNDAVRAEQVVVEDRISK